MKESSERKKWRLECNNRIKNKNLIKQMQTRKDQVIKRKQVKQKDGSYLVYDIRYNKLNNGNGYHVLEESL